MKSTVKFNIKPAFLSIVFILISYSKSEIHINDKLIREISIIDNGNNDSVISYIPEKATNLLYLKLDNNKMISINALELQDIYSSYYKNNYKTFYNFLNKALKQEVSLKTNQVQKYEVIMFSLDNNIIQTSANQIEKKYLKKINNETFYFYPKDIDLNQNQTILYKMFINNYLISFDDYGGKYIITKYK
ncbi:hypothetical protein [Chryseobacterium sp. MDT2-18]|uniref:hypothetical protein n=1 Tax=Chryseobacterium sp. MDT2-18 TaxID=1259136 RepID=UPI00278308F3|nr:hypothetical protein [Chryseobacterium sp. MDT2-18]MDQ0476705.1 hypothetical protein [Chryseobacterium sp. MDT2-18]